MFYISIVHQHQQHQDSLPRASPITDPFFFNCQPCELRIASNSVGGGSEIWWRKIGAKIVGGRIENGRGENEATESKTEEKLKGESKTEAFRRGEN